MSEKRYYLKSVCGDEGVYDKKGGCIIVNVHSLINLNENWNTIVDLLNEQEQKIQRWKKLYEIKDAEVTARVDALNKVCEYYTSEVLFKSDTNPNQAVKEVINAILNTEVEM